MTNKKPILKELPVKLTDQETLDRSRALARKLGDMLNSEAEKKLWTAAYKEQITEMEVEAKRLSAIVRAGTELRPVPCTISRNYDRGIVEWFREDTGELVDSRAMTSHERQQTMSIVDSAIG